MTSEWMKRVMQAAGIAVAGLGALVLIGWQTHQVLLIQLLPTQPPMQRMTAVSLLLSGLSLLLAGMGRRKIAALCGLVPLIIAGLVLMEYVLGVDFGIDQVLGRDYAGPQALKPGRMSPVTALCLVASSVALLVTASRGGGRLGSCIVGILASMLMAVGTVSVLGFLFGHTETYGWGEFTRMALHTAASFAVIGAGLMSWAWQERHEKPGAPEWLPWSIGLGLAVAVLGVWQVLRTHEANDLPLISAIILTGGLLGALLVAVTAAQAQHAQKRSRELQASSQMFQQLFDVAPDGLLMIDHNGLIVRANEQAEKIFGYSQSELLEQPVEKLVPGKLRDVHRSHRENYHSRSSTRAMGDGLELLAVRKDSTQFPVEIALTPLQTPAKETMVVAVVRDITERKQAEEALRQSEERFRSIFEQGPLGIVLMGLGGRMIRVNESFCRMLGYSEAELISITPFDITHPDDREASVDLMELLFHHDLPIGKLEKRYVKKNGETMWASLSASVIRDQEGRPLYSLGVVEDITERKHAEAQVRLGNEIFANMEEAVCLVRAADGIIVHANPKFEKMFGYEPDELTGKHVEGINADAPRHPEEIAEEIRTEIRRSGVWRGEVLHQRKDRSPFWCSVTVSMFHHPEFGEVGISLHQDITQLKLAQEALRESEERFRSIFEQGPIGVALLGTDHRMTRTNPAFCKMLGYSEAELAGMTPLDMTHPDDLKYCAGLLQRLDRGEIPVCRMEKRYRKKNGEFMWASLTASVIRDEQGSPLCGLGMVEDITERKQAEQKLAEQAVLLDLAHDSIAVRDMQGRIVFWNHGAQDTYGWTAEEAMGQTPREFLQTRYPIPLQEIEAAVLKRGHWEGELEQVTRTGEPIVVDSRWSVWRDENGEPKAILVINRDITERKQAEEQLRSLTERLSLATRTSSIGIWDWDLSTNQVVWDDTVFAIFGIPKVVPMAFEAFSRTVHPEDLTRVQESLQRAVDGKTQDFVEFRIIRPDGSVRHVYSAQGAVLDEHGNVVRVVGTGVDITERKRMEAQIEANKAQLVASARLSALGMMAGNIAHEINNPVGIIHALASDLMDTVKEEGAASPQMVERNSSRIRETAERIARIIKSMRQISREGAADKFQPTRVGKVVEETLEICRERFRANAVKLLLPKEMPELMVSCREVQIAQVLLNLLQNAFDAVAEQPGERWVRLDVSPSNDSVEISVTDSGPGILPELRPHLMEPFFTTKPVGKGTGLGLSLSRTIAEEHGGKLEYSEDQGHTQFSLVLPLARQEEAVWS